MDLLADTHDYLSQGGLVMIPLILVSLSMWTLIVERLLAFRRLIKIDIRPGEVVRILRTGVLPDGERGLRARILKLFIEGRTGDREHDLRLLELCTMQEHPQIAKHLAIIAVLAAVAPLLGLLGTVTGMITTFEVLSVFGTGNAKALAGGVSEALITTQTGLLIAIPGLYMSAYLARRAQRLDRRLDEIKLALRGHLLSKKTNGKPEDPT